jgi:hypothetical protein
MKMYLNINLDDEIGTQMTAMAKSRGQSIDILAHEAITKWLHQQNQKTPTLWPPEFMEFTGVKDFPPFESYRTEWINFCDF